MPLYQLILQDSSEVPSETLQFIAGDLRAALTFADRHTAPLPAELWCEGKRVCKLELSDTAGAWVIVGQSATSAVNKGG